MTNDDSISLEEWVKLANKYYEPFEYLIIGENQFTNKKKKTTKKETIPNKAINPPIVKLFD